MPRGISSPSTTGAFTSRNGTVWIQPKGCGTPMYMLGCVNLDELAIGKGTTEFIKCFNPFNSEAFVTVGNTLTAPDDIEFDITAYIGAQASWLDWLASLAKCPVPMYVLIGCKINKGYPTGWERGFTIGDARVTTTSYANLAARNEDAAMEMTATIMASAPNAANIIRPKVTTQEVEFVYGFRDIAFASETNCGGPCGDPVTDCETGFAVGATDTVNGSVISKAMRDCIGYEIVMDGVTPSAPFTGVDDDVASMVISRLSGYPRHIAVRGNVLVGAGAQVSISDDNGVNWSVINVGSLLEQTAMTSNALFQREDGTVWLVLSAGFIYVSEDNGSTWTARESGVLTAGEDLHAIHFRDNVYGMAGGATGLLLVSYDSGEEWFLLNQTPDDLGRYSPVVNTDTVTAIYAVDRNWFVATDGGELWKTQDFINWDKINFSGQLIGAISDIEFYGCAGVLLFNDGTNRGRVLYSMNGFFWEPLETPPNNGLNSVKMLSETEFWIAGDTHNGHGVIMKGTAYPLI